MRAITFISAAMTFLAAASAALSAQPVKVNMKFDKVSRAEVEMQAYEPDTTAAAVVLLDAGKTAITFDAKGRICLQTYHHERIKILKEEGVSHGDYELVYYTKLGLNDKISGVKVITYNLNDGEIVRTRMSKNYIFDEEFADNYRKLSFSAQDVRAGSVIEVEYDITSYTFWDFDKVYFQRSIPVNLFEYEVRIPEFAGVNKRVSGYNRINHTSEKVNERYTLGGGYIDFTTTVERYSGHALPAMKKEPYSYSFQQYLSAVDYEVSNLDIPGRLPQHFSVNWEDVDKGYYESSIISRMNEKCLFPEGVKAIAGTADTDQDKIMEIRNLIRSKISWDGKYRLFPKRGSQTYKEKTGSNADLNAIIASCLRAAGYKVEPVLIKMRSSGVLIPGLPELNPYDTYILRIDNASGNPHYLDGGSADQYLNILPPEFLVSSARLLREPGRCQWIDLTGIGKNMAGYIINARLDESGVMTGEMNVKYIGEDCWSFKKDVRKAGSQAEYVTALENICAINAEEYKFVNFDKPSKECTFSCKFEKEIDNAGNLLYISPFLRKFHSVTDFSSPTRTCPIEFPYKGMITYIMNLELPENFKVEQLPESDAIGLPCMKTACKVLYGANGNKVQVSFNFIMSEMLAAADDYQQIRDFWQLLCGIYDDMIVVSKNAD